MVFPDWLGWFPIQTGFPMHKWSHCLYICVNLHPSVGINCSLNPSSHQVFSILLSSTNPDLSGFIHLAILWGMNYGIPILLHIHPYISILFHSNPYNSPSFREREREREWRHQHLRFGQVQWSSSASSLAHPHARTLNVWQKITKCKVTNRVWSANGANLGVKILVRLQATNRSMTPSIAFPDLGRIGEGPGLKRWQISGSWSFCRKWWLFKMIVIAGEITESTFPVLEIEIMSKSFLLLLHPPFLYYFLFGTTVCWPDPRPKMFG